MALTTAQRASIRMYCGWSSRFLQTDSRLEQAMGAVDNDADTLALIVGLLASLADIDAKLLDAHGRIKAAELVGEVVLPGQMELGSLRSEGRRFVGRMTSLLGVEVRHDVFSGTGSHHFSGYGGTYGGTGGNLPPLG